MGVSWFEKDRPFSIARSKREIEGWNAVLPSLRDFGFVDAQEPSAEALRYLLGWVVFRDSAKGRCKIFSPALFLRAGLETLDKCARHWGGRDANSPELLIQSDVKP